MLERRQYKIGKYDIVAQPAQGSMHMLRYTVMLNGKRLGIPAQGEFRLGLDRVPVARGELVGELLRLPADEAGEIARVVRRLLDDAVDRVGARRDEEIAEQAQRRRPRVSAHDGENGAG